MDRRGFLIGGSALGVLTAACASQAAPFVEPHRRLPAPALDPKPAKAGPQTIVLAGGCFWGIQALYQHVKGVQKAVSGYCGGTGVTAKYDVVTTGVTDHAESVQVVYDPAVISFGQILQIFFSMGTDPTQTNGQYPDIGKHYRGVIWYTTPEQKAVAEAYIAQLNAARIYRKRIATKVLPAKRFYPAEAYHQDYALKNPEAPYIVMFDAPKLRSLKVFYPQMYREVPLRQQASNR